jgi:hypothetical protein
LLPIASRNTQSAFISSSVKPQTKATFKMSALEEQLPLSFLEKADLVPAIFQIGG